MERRHWLYKLEMPLQSGRGASEDLHLSKALFLLDPDKLQLHCLLGLGAWLCCKCMFLSPLDQTCMEDVAKSAGHTRCLHPTPLVLSLFHLESFLS